MLKNLKLKKLNNLYNYSIKFDKSQDIFIFHGLNGYGKTTVLQLIHICLSGSFPKLYNYDFDQLELELVSGQIITIKKEKISQGIFTEEMFASHGHISEARSISLKANPKYKYILNYKDKNIDIKDYEIPYTPSDERIYRRRVRTSNGEMFYIDDGDRNRDPANLKKFKKITEAFPIYKTLLIETNRLRYKGEDNKVEERLEKLPKEVANIITIKLNEFAQKSQNLEYNFPQQVIEHFEKLKKLNKNDIKRKASVDASLEKLKQDAENLRKIGFLRDEGNIKSMPKDYDDTILPLLEVYCKDTGEKLKLWDGIYSRFNLFLDIINTKLINKKIYIDNEGYKLSVKDSKGNSIPLNRLSSGEQHILVMIFDLIFSDSYQIIMLDEPEISLHVAWQANFLKDLKRILEVNKIVVLIATHSPTIIGDEWDLAYDLTALAS